ncbi:GGDEF domain-containing protein [Paradevosia shaoguanensis]|uniref:diguanylate cyclase n=1 Tax=Paradevosia shaoguanensis TaxID=1335043 RepID=A0AA41UGQ7_9HYPH|nr:sensor domain-containing diguanylate cyclase [Paradevosia shaoguanensis]MCF1743148.1 diguanylate cyclase [Paradevosia shaoguanensis]MCI0127631.1 diguanylate cyclase [Paradevosia shaoguanensis]
MTELRSDPARAGRGMRHAAFFVLAVFIAIFIAAILGGLSRPLGFLATFWPANALLAGLLYRADRKLRWPAGVVATFAYVIADVLIGDDLVTALWLSAANIAGVAVVVAVLDRLDPQDATLQRPQGVLYLLIATALGSAVAGLVGISSVVNVTGQAPAAGWMSWAASELGNYLSLLPVVLTAPPLNGLMERQQFTLPPLRNYAPQLLALFASFVLTIVVRDQVSIVFPILALLWCALSFPVFVTALLVMFYSDLAMFSVKFDLISLGGEDLGGAIMSVHLALAMVALGPIMVSSTNAARNALLRQLERVARHDALTNALSRSAFYEAAESLLATTARTNGNAAVLVLDVDHFKRVNDEHGHPAGDKTLVAIAAAIQTAIRQSDIFGRVGGEEFALLLPNISMRESMAIAERIRGSVEKLLVFLDDGEVLQTTLSVGVTHARAEALELDQFIGLADRALYLAKGGGRNRVVFLEGKADAKS